MSIPLPPGAADQPPDQPLTDFQRAVVDVVRSLHPGDIVTYADVAMEIDRPGAAQAVANVLRRVPGLPWWRVIPTGGRLYRTHEPTQRPLLEAEGVVVGRDGRVHGVAPAAQRDHDRGSEPHRRLPARGEWLRRPAP